MEEELAKTFQNTRENTAMAVEGKSELQTSAFVGQEV